MATSASPTAPGTRGAPCASGRGRFAGPGPSTGERGTRCPPLGPQHPRCGGKQVRPTRAPKLRRSLAGLSRARVIWKVAGAGAQSLAGLTKCGDRARSQGQEGTPDTSLVSRPKCWFSRSPGTGRWRAGRPITHRELGPIPKGLSPAKEDLRGLAIVRLKTAFPCGIHTETIGDFPKNVRPVRRVGWLAGVGGCVLR